MTISYSLFKNVLRKSIVDSMYKEIISKTSRYYHWLGKENTWRDFLSPFIPSSTSDSPGPPANNFRYDLHVRRDILTVKAITSSDVSYVVPRINWSSNIIYDMYDDAYTTPIEEAIQWTPSGIIETDDIVKNNSIYYRAINAGIFGAIAPSHVNGTVTNGTVQLSYLDRDTFAASGATSLETSRFYVLTSEFNVYKCIWNNNNLPSTIMPTTTPSDTIVDTADGYRWKFLYTIPVSLRNRFLSSDWMPVTTALKTPFFSNGEITSLSIDNPGSGYIADVATGTGATSGANITLNISGTVTGVFELGMIVSGTNIIPGTTIIAQVSGTTGGVGSYTLSKASTGTVSGTIKAITPNDIIIVSGDGYLEDNPYIISDIDIIQGGLGYTTTPDIEFADPALPGTTSEGSVTISSGIVNSTNLSVVGFGYDDFPVITVDEPIAFDGIWESSSLVDLNDIIKHNVTITIAGKQYQQDIYYEVTASTTGQTGIDGPDHPTGSEPNGGVTLTVVAKRAVLKAALTKTEAKLIPIFEGGQLTGVIIEDGGIGYTNANIQIFGSGGGAPSGTGAIVTANFVVGNVNTLQADVELDATPGSIEVIKVVDAGSGYGTVDIEILGDGTGATAEGRTSAGQLSEVIITDPGLGYTWTDVVITGTGTGATARAIMSPLGGHGSNAIDELNANSLMFYSSISRDRNQGIEIDNDYRKAGLLKNIKQFNTGLIFKDDVGSGCVLIKGNFDPLKMGNDLLLQKEGYKNYRVVSFNNTEILLSVFNNFTIDIGDQLTIMEKDAEGNDNIGYTFTVTDVTERTIDQFSGDLLFLTVREPYSPTAEQIVTLRTVITI